MLFCSRELIRSSLGRLSLVGRWNEARYKKGKRDGNLNKSTFLPIHHTLGGRAYPVRHYPVAIRLRTRKEYAILCIALTPQSGDFSGAILGVRSVALLHLGLLPARNREGTTGRNLKKCTQIDYPTRSKLLEKSKQSKLNYFVCHFADDVAEFGWGEAVKTLTVGYNTNTAHLYRGRGE